MSAYSREGHGPDKERRLAALTNILDPQKLSAKTAAKFYRWRWRNEASLQNLQADAEEIQTRQSFGEGSFIGNWKDPCWPLQILLAHADLACGGARRDG